MKIPSIAGVAEASEMWVCKLVMFIQILLDINGLHQRKELKCGCAAAHPAHPVPPPLYYLKNVKHHSRIRTFLANLIIVSISHHSSESFLLLLCASFSQSRRSARKSRSRRILSTTTQQCVALLRVHARPFSLENYWATNLLILSTRLCYCSTQFKSDVITDNMWCNWIFSDIPEIEEFKKFVKTLHDQGIEVFQKYT